ASTILYAAGLNGWCEAGIHLWKSTDTGGTWTEVFPAGLPANANIMAIRVQRGNPNSLVAISAASRFTGARCGAGSSYPNEAPNQAFFSNDGGKTFSPIVIPTTVAALQQGDGTDTWAYVEDVKFDELNVGKLWATVTANPKTNAEYWTIDGELWMSD